MIKDLIKLANDLDKKGFSKEADALDIILRKEASNTSVSHMPQAETHALLLEAMEAIKQGAQSVLWIKGDEKTRNEAQGRIGKAIIDNVHKAGLHIDTIMKGVKDD